ncbi:MAG: hypothetical protein ACYSO4_03790 [Planctomycetota bacterium]|jgi:hypothetical protein
MNPQTPDTETLKIGDLKDQYADIQNAENLMSFRVLTFTAVPDVAGRLNELFELLSEEEVRAVSKEAFRANGFSIGVGSFEDGPKITQKMTRIGAVRTGQSRLMFPPQTQETLSRTPLQGTEIVHYSTLAGEPSTATSLQGFLSWVFSAKPDPRFRGMAQIKLFPALWQPGMESIHIAMGKPPIDYKSIPEGQVLARVEEGGFLLLGPGRNIPEETTLDKLLFFLPGRRPRVQFFVVICDSAGN